jgi:hypothetical protein
MADQFTVPEEYTASFRRILPYLAAPMQKNLQILESLLLYLKLGGEKMARIAIEAMNVTQRLQDAEVKKLLREQELLNDEQREDLEDEDDDNEEDEDNQENQPDIDATDKDDLIDDDED